MKKHRCPRLKLTRKEFYFQLCMYDVQIKLKRTSVVHLGTNTAIKHYQSRVMMRYNRPTQLMAYSQDHIH
jgi:hypothetical protein